MNLNIFDVQNIKENIFIQLFLLFGIIAFPLISMYLFKMGWFNFGIITFMLTILYYYKIGYLIKEIEVILK